MKHIKAHNVGFLTEKWDMKQIDEGVNEFDGKGYTKLFLAVYNGDKETVKQLIDSGANVNLRNKQYIKSLPIIIAGQVKDPEIIQMLINAGAKINVKNNDGLSPMDLAVPNNNLPVVKILLDNGAPVNKVSAYYKEAPLGIVEKYWNTKEDKSSMIKLLKQYGAK